MERSLKNRYWVFVIMQYYPNGGLSDIEFTSNSLDECIEFINKDDTYFASYSIFDADLRDTIEYEKPSLWTE